MPPLHNAALITGASSGIGLAWARALAGEGRPLVLIARRRDRLEALAASVSVPCLIIDLDLAEHDAPARVMRAVEEAEVEVSTAVLCAGFGWYGPFAEAPRERLVQMVDLGCRGVLDLCHRLLPGMLARKEGELVVISSVGALLPTPRLGTYAAVKCFELVFMETLYEELRGTGVKALVVCPGPTRTGFAEIAGVNGEAAGPLTIEAEAVVRAGRQAIGRRPVVFVGPTTGLTAFLTRLVPRRLVVWLSGIFTRDLGRRDTRA
jgi:short-subunit dehydrogenase